MSEEAPQGESPLAKLGALAVQQVQLSDGLVHMEIYTMTGLLSVLWHAPQDAENVLIAFGGALGGLLGPADGLYQDLGETLANTGIGTMRVSYRRPNNLELCIEDAKAAAALAVGQGALNVITMGHSFGGAVAIQAGAAALRSSSMPNIAGVVTLATQAAGCEVADQLNEVPVLLVHGTNDQLLPHQASQLVQSLCGGRVVLMDGADHLLKPGGEELRALLKDWVLEQFAELGQNGKRAEDESSAR